MHEPTADQIDEIFSRYRSRGSPGAAVAVMKDGRVVHTAGYGLADIERGARNTPTTVFNLGSVAKQFTAFATFLLEADGKLSLEDDIRSHLPELHAHPAVITLDHLLHHSSGLRDTYPDLMLLSGWRFTDTLTNGDTLRWLFAQQELNFEPGAEYAYANANYVLLAEVVARVSGVSFAEFCRDRIFGPLRMTRTVIHDDVNMVIPDRALGYHEGDRGAWLNVPLADSVVGPTNVYSTVEDLTRWLAELETSRVGGDGVIARMLERGELRDGTPLTYAGGLEVRELHGRRLVEHGGQHGGYCAWVLWLPDDRVGVIVAYNHFTWTMREPALAVADLFLGGTEGDDLDPEPDLETIVLPEDSLRSLTGTYFDAARSRVRTVAMDHGSLTYAGLPLVPLGPKRFALVDAPRVTIDFSQGGLAVHSPDEGTYGYRRMDPADPSTARLADYTGLYHSEELGVWWQVAVAGGRLRIHRPRFPPTNAEALFGDVFADDWSPITGFPFTFTLAFERTGDQITSLLVSGDGVRRLRFRRTASSLPAPHHTSS